MSKVPSDPDVTQQQCKGQGLKHRTGLLVKTAEQAGPGRRYAAGPSFGDGGDLPGDTPLPRKNPIV